jgi:hypothetical protein
LDENGELQVTPLLNPGLLDPLGVTPVDNETYVYGAISLLVLATLGYMSRKWYNEYAAKNNIKKEINKRFRFGNDDDNQANQR